MGLRRREETAFDQILRGRLRARELCRFLLPTALFKSLRTRSSSNLLELTSVSPGGARGSTVTRRVLVQVPKKSKPKRR